MMNRILAAIGTASQKIATLRCSFSSVLKADIERSDEFLGITLGLNSFLAHPICRNCCVFGQRSTVLYYYTVRNS